MSRRRLPLAGFLLLALTLPARASAHATLVRSSPAAGAVVARGPASIVLDFDESVRPGSGTRLVANRGGGAVRIGPPRLARGDSRRLLIPLRQRLRDGAYTVRWRIVSDEGHLIAGVFAFAVGRGQPPPQPTLSAGGGGLRLGFLAARWLFLLGLLVAAGAAVFRGAVWRVAAAELPFAVRGRASAAGTRLASISIAVGLAGAAVGAWASLALTEDALQTRFGLVSASAAALATGAALAAALSLRLRDALLPAASAALLLLAAPTLAGHALDPGRPQALSIAADLLHLASAAVWFGGLLQLALAPLAGRPLNPELRGRLYAALARRFSTVALAAVLVLAASGLARALVELSTPAQLWQTGYGRTLLVKSSLLAGLLGLGALNRRALLPRLAAAAARNPAGERVAGLRRSVSAELVLLATALAAVALLTDLRPGRDQAKAAAPTARQASLPAGPAVPRSPRGAVVLAREDGDLAVGLALQTVGRRLVLTTSVLGPDGGAFNGLSVGYRLRPAAGLAADKPAEACAPGCYRATIAAPRRLRLLTLELSGGGRPPARLRFRLPTPWPPPDASELVRRAARSYRALRTLVIHERPASSPRNAVVTTYAIAAPDRLSYRIRGGGQAIIIGGRRWDRTSPRGRWIASTQTPLTQPTPFWGGRFYDARLVGRSRLNGRTAALVTLFDPQIPGWFTLAIDPATARTLELRMVAAAHFMHHRYGPFNAPVRIRPPG